MVLLKWHKYKYYPYEKQLAVREVERLLEPADVTETADGLIAEGVRNPEPAKRLVYFASSTLSDSQLETPTEQARLELLNGVERNRQATRYSAHGLHEYKGKFNPQIAKALMNIFGASEGDWALDPFCGSGTSLVEAAHLGINVTGTDINPLAVFLANAKIASLSIPASQLVKVAEKIAAELKGRFGFSSSSDARTQYLASWFADDVLAKIERLREKILTTGGAFQNVLLALASNLLRDYSLQEPSDLRIRRRSSPMPEVPLEEAYLSAVSAFAQKLESAQTHIGQIKICARAELLDCRNTLVNVRPRNSHGFDFALTSPPYATALPYIDTQRLSLVWLGLVPASQILSLEAKLIGSRELRGHEKKVSIKELTENAAKLPVAEASLCLELKAALGEADGFRRQAVPQLLYRYFAGMAESFHSIREVMKPGGKYGLIVGGNHTTLGGKRFDINTPAHLANLALSRGWRHCETVELQTYKRYGLHAKNSGTTESLIILEA